MKDFIEDKTKLYYINANSINLSEQLEYAIKFTDFICIFNYMDLFFNIQTIHYFIQKYRQFLKYFYFNKEEKEKNCLYLKFNCIINKKNNSYTILEQEYDEQYYLKDCGGYERFIASEGKEIDSRIKEIFILADAKKTDKILDVGCGRGELSYKLHLSGAEVLGIDYSKDAVKIAERTYGNIKKSNLIFLCEDIFHIEYKNYFDKIIMADIVEHIEQEMLEKLFYKLKTMLSDKGVLIIHTAPNKEYYDLYYPLMVQTAKSVGAYLPLNPRSYYEELMHINEQTPSGLKAALEKVFSSVKVWTGGLQDVFIEKTAEDSRKDNAIFAICKKRKEMVKENRGFLWEEPDKDKIGVKIKSEKECIETNKEIISFRLFLTNTGEQSFYSYGKYPINIAYHILDKNETVIIFDGDRTTFDKPLRSDETAELKINIRLTPPPPRNFASKGRIYT